jgi:DNA-binding NarL/FixJ family response regulator
VSNPNQDARIKVLIADEQSLFREAVRAVLQNTSGFEVVGEARDGLQAVAEAQRVHPDVVIIDANLPNCDGIRATSLIRSHAPDRRVLVLSDEEDQRTLLAALEAGASGYLSKASPLTELIEAVRGVHEGSTLIPTQMVGALVGRLLRRQGEQDEALRRASKLSRREREVLALLVNGADNDAIARELVISPQTARTHIQNLLAKLGVHSRLEAVAFVRGSGILEDLVGVDG